MRWSKFRGEEGEESGTTDCTDFTDLKRCCLGRLSGLLTGFHAVQSGGSLPRVLTAIGKAT